MEEFVGGDIFSSPDQDHIAKITKAEEKGTTDGQANNPPKNSEFPSPSEQHILSHCRSAVEESSNTISEMLSRQEGERINLKVVSQVEGIKARPGKLESSLKNLKNIHRSQLANLKKKRDEAFRDLKAFQNTNDLSEVAKSIDSPLFLWAVILVSFLFEAGLNSTLYARAQTGGLLEGIGVASLISFISVGGAVLLAITFVRMVNHIVPVRRLYGLLGTLMGSLIILAVNLLAGHYRDAARSNPEDAGITAVESLKSSPFGIESFEGSVLTGAGILIAIFTGWKVYSSYDPYPGYNKATDNYTSKDSGWEEGKEFFMEKMEDKYKEVKARVNELMNETSRAKAEFARSLSDSQSLVKRLSQHINEWEVCSRNLINRYRDKNSKMRENRKDIPAYFSKAPSVDFSDLKLNIQDLGFDSEKEQLKQYSSEISQFEKKELGKIRSRIEKIHEGFLDEAKSYFDSLSSEE